MAGETKIYNVNGAKIPLPASLSQEQVIAEIEHLQSSGQLGPVQNRSPQEIQQQAGQYVERNNPLQPTPTDVVPSEQYRQLEGALPPGIDPVTSGMLSPDEAYEVIPSSGHFDTLGQTLGGVGGSMAGFEAGAKVGRALPTPLKQAAPFVGSAVGAIVGGGVGEAAQQGYQLGWAKDKAPIDAEDSLKRIAAAGGTEGVYDAVGSAIFGPAGWAYNKTMRPVVKETAIDLMRIMERGGTQASLDQIVDKGIMRQVVALTRDAVIGSAAFKDQLQDKSMTDFLDSYVSTMTGKTIDEVSPESAGRAIIDIINDGKAVHSEMAGEMYKVLDDIVQTKTVQQPVTRQSNVLGPDGQPIQSTGVETVERGIVDVRPLKELAAKRLAKIEEAKISPSDDARTLLNNIIDQDDFVKFSTAHEMRSGILQRKRALSSRKEDQPIADVLNNGQDIIAKQMDQAGKQLDPENYKKYREAQNFWRSGREDFNNKLLKSLLGNEDNPERIGMALARRGNQANIGALRKAVQRAASQSGKNFGDLWKDVQGGYLSQMMPASADELVKATDFRNLHRKRELQRRLDGVFTGEQKESLIRISKIADEAIEARKSKGFLNLRQLTAGGQLTAMATGQLLGASTAAASGAELTAAAFLFGPAVIARIATNPKGRLAKAFYRLSEQPTGAAQKTKALTNLAAQLGIPPTQLNQFLEAKLAEMDQGLEPKEGPQPPLR